LERSFAKKMAMFFGGDWRRAAGGALRPHGAASVA
jgi:hypothetical protein